MNDKQKHALRGWRELNKTLSEFNEGEVKEMLDHEMCNLMRTDIVKRLHQRYSILRSDRERTELVAKIDTKLSFGGK